MRGTSRDCSGLGRRGTSRTAGDVRVCGTGLRGTTRDRELWVGSAGTHDQLIAGPRTTLACLTGSSVVVGLGFTIS